MAQTKSISLKDLKEHLFQVAVGPTCRDLCCHIQLVLVLVSVSISLVLVLLLVFVRVTVSVGVSLY